MAKKQLTYKELERKVKKLERKAVDHGKAEESLGELIRFERLLTNLSAKFVNLPVNEVDKELEQGLKLIVLSLGFDRSAIMQFSEDQATLKWTHFYGTGIRESKPGFLISTEHPWFTGKLRRGETICICSPDEILEEGELESKWMQRVGMKANVTIPLAVGGVVLGGIAFSSFSEERIWPNAVIQRLQLVGEVFAGALIRKGAELKLKKAFSKIKELKDQLQKENFYLQEEIKLKHKHEEIIGQSDAIKEVLSMVEQVSDTDSTVLILGETGTGKELLAREIHKLSSRKSRAMVKVNCATLPSTLVEAELFGHEKGAYTGALSKQIGRFEVAHGSTLFLDEIGEMPLELQTKLLRVLQEGQFERLGSSKIIRVDVRAIAASNRDLDRAVQDGKFREDLYYRLNVFPISAPPLRERQEDIPLLVSSFVKEFEDAMGKSIERFSRKSMEALQRYPWPGNVRELRNVIERGMIMSKDGTLDIILPHIKHNTRLKDMTLKEIERNHILDVLKKTRWRVRGKNGAAEILGLKPSTLESKMVKLNVKRKK